MTDYRLKHENDPHPNQRLIAYLAASANLLSILSSDTPVGRLQAEAILNERTQTITELRRLLDEARALSTLYQEYNPDLYPDSEN